MWEKDRHDLPCEPVWVSGDLTPLPQITQDSIFAFFSRQHMLVDRDPIFHGGFGAKQKGMVLGHLFLVIFVIS